MARDTSGELEFLTEGLPENKINREVALEDLRRFLEDRKLIKKTLRKAEDEEGLENFEAAKDIIISCIMDGSIVVTESPCKLIHTLTNPPKDADGNVLYETLEYGFVPDVIALRKADNFKEDQTMARTQALLSAMTRKAVKELGKVSSQDLDVVGAVAFFLV